MIILQEPRDYNMTMKEQKNRLDSEYINFKYLYCYRSHNVAKIVFISEGRKEEKNDNRN